uniref:E2F transcription factor CC-MB domain-containing protein n=1 Tax=Denticeps clupeoides TaxID=299321 RepID=A0AAY3ZZ52_9TELE
GSTCNSLTLDIYTKVGTLGYVTYQDIRSIGSLQDQTVIAVKAPSETKLEVPESSGGSLQIYLKSTNGPIEVYLCPEEVLEDLSPVKSATPRKDCSHPAVPAGPHAPKQAPEAGMRRLSPHAAPRATNSRAWPSPRTRRPPFVSFSPPLDHDDYLWSLEDGEGVSDFFDTYDLGDLLRS